MRVAVVEVRPGNPRIPVTHVLLEGDPAAEIARYADGVIVGSAFVRAVIDADSDSAAARAVGALAAELAEGVRRR